MQCVCVGVFKVRTSQCDRFEVGLGVRRVASSLLLEFSVNSTRQFLKPMGACSTVKPLMKDLHSNLCGLG